VYIHEVRWRGADVALDHHREADLYQGTTVYRDVLELDNPATARAVSDLAKQLAVPGVALVAGGILVLWPSLQVMSQLLTFFGAQIFMNIYMKAVLSNSVISETLQMKGFQGPLILTSFQQLISFLILIVGVLLSRLTRTPYQPKRISSFGEVVSIWVLAVSFAANIALNNFSLALLDLSVNVMIRSVSPVFTLMLQVILARWVADVKMDLSMGKVLFMLMGLGCAVVVVLSKSQSMTVSSSFGLGIILCVASLLASSLELIAVMFLCKGSKMNSIDTVLYMSLPVVAILVFPSLFLKHPVAYPGHGNMTDWSVFTEVCRLNAWTMVLVLLSGAFALGYNLLLYTVVKDLSPFTAAFAANFNKVVAIGLALVLGFEQLPQMPWGIVMVVGMLGNIASFSGYTLVSSRAKSPAKDTAESPAADAAKK